MINFQNSSSKLNKQEIAKFLDSYFAQRGSFLAQVIRADLQSLPSLTHENGNGNSKTKQNEVTAINTIQPEVIHKVSTNVEAILVDLVVQQTGFLRESIALESQILDDLNLDSIKAGELIANAAKKCGVAGQLDPSALTNASLKKVAQEIKAAIQKQNQEIVATNQVAVAGDHNKVMPESIDLSNLILKLVEERTGFPQNSLKMDLRLLDDLNLDSIKAGDLVATAAKQVGASDKIDASTLANATLADVIATIERAWLKVKENSASTSISKNILAAPSNNSSWVRNFAIKYVPQDAPQREQENWHKAKVLIVSDVVETPIAQALNQQFLLLGAQIEQVTYQKLSSEESLLKAGFSHYLALLPRFPNEDESIQIAQMVARLKSISSVAANSCVAYVQFGGGYFGSGSQTLNPEVCCAGAFARSLHLERSDLRVRVVDLAEEIELPLAAELVIKELSGSLAIATVGYNAELVRLVPQSRQEQPNSYSKRSISWSEKDVILVTGGAKGITAECALAVARTTGVKMALVGHSPVPDSRQPQNEITQTLERFQAANLTCSYYSCDITQADAVAKLVTSITEELGEITGVIHGAGLNTPRRCEAVSLEEAVIEVSPKLLGAYNILQLIKTPPKLFVAFSSIIGVTGMPGNCWYAFANESLDIMLRHFESKHPQTQVLSLAYSVWGEVGMGARMGSVKNLERMGIGAISTTEGVSRFLHLFKCDPGVKQVIIAARLGGLDTWNPVSVPKTTGLRFIEQILEVEPGIELKARTHLSLENDLYIQDHIWRGSYLFPTVFGLEAMAQATAYVTGEQKLQIVRIEDISLKRPIVVNPTTGVTIELHAEVMEVNADGERRVKVSIRTEQTGFTNDHFAAILVLGELQLGVKTNTQPGEPITLDPQTELYGDLLFQGERFRRMDSIFSLDEKSCVLSSYVRPTAKLLAESFAPDKGGYLLLGDPYFRDVLLQSVQLTIPQHICLPVKIDKIEFFQNSSSNKDSRLVNVLLLGKEGQEYDSEVIAIDARGYIVERLTGYHLRILEENLENPTATELVNPNTRDLCHVEEVLNNAFKEFGLKQPSVALGYVPNLHAQSRKQRRQQEQLIIDRALKMKLGLSAQEEIDFGIKTLSSGKPELTGSRVTGLNLSLSHCSRYCLCVVDSTPQGCDIEVITPRTEEDWVALLTSERNAVVDELVQQGDKRDTAGTRIWSALEAVRKAFNGCQPKFSVVTKKGRAVLLKTEIETGDYLVVTVPIKLTRPPERMVAILVPQPQLQQKSQIVKSQIIKSPSFADQENYPDRHSTRYTQDGPQGQPAYEQRFQVSFKESGSISRRVYFSQYFRWIGKIRELPMESIAAKMLSDFLSGDWGMVTNAVSLRVFGEATSYDIIQAKAWVGNVVGSSFDTYIEFCRVLPDNSLERMAVAEVKATWVRLVSYGIPSPMPFPKYLQEYLDVFAAKQPASLDLRKPEIPLPPLPARFGQINLGSVIYQAPITLGHYGKLLQSEVFQTTLEESNLVGNVYYGNYFIWQGRILDLFLYSIAPEYLRVSNPHGEIVCLYSRMDYLREAMPFDKIRVFLYVQSITEAGALFNFEFFREQPDGTMEKLHVGQQEVVWVTRLADGTPTPANWPEKVMEALVGKCHDEYKQAISL